MTTIISLSTYWGSRFGGVNSFNQSFVTALAKTYPNHQFLNISLDASHKQLAELDQIGNLSAITATSKATYIDGAPAAIDDQSRKLLIDALTSATENDRDFILVGHDIYTGPFAIDIADRLRSDQRNHVRLAIVRHVDFADYQPHDLGRDQTDIYKRNRLQTQTLRAADVVFAVGPILYRSCRDSNLPVSELTPGMQRSGFNPQNKYPSIATFGRLDQANNYVKQSATVVDAFIRLIRAAREDPIRTSARFWRDARLTLIGVEDAQANTIKTHINNETGIAANVHAVPFIDDHGDIKDLFQSRGVNIGIVPSLRESFGLVALEFIGHGIPLILSERTGAYEWLHNVYAGEALGCIGHYAPLGSANPATANTTDVNALLGLVERACADLPLKLRNANLLRRRLAVHSWSETALQFGTVLGLDRADEQSQEVERGVTQLAMLQAQFNAKVSVGIAAARAKEIMANLDKFVSAGRYRSAEVELEYLKRIGSRTVTPRQIKQYEIQLETRLGSYLLAIKSINEWSRLKEVPGEDWDETDLRMESLRNIALRDMAQYHEAAKHAALLVAWHEKWVGLAPTDAEKSHRTLHLGSALRKKARCLAYIGDEADARAALEQALPQAPAPTPLADKGKWLFGFGEILRHNGKYEESLVQYTSALEIAQEQPDLDLYTWACFCLSDSFFMLGRSGDAWDTLILAKNAIALFGEVLPVESSHIELSEVTLHLSEGKMEVADAADRLSLVYKSRGVEWVEAYLATMKRTRRPPFVKRF